MNPAAKKILIVEDDFFIRDLYQTQAQLSGFTVNAAEDGEAGLAKIKSFLPDIVLLDLMIPKMDGLTILKTVRSDTSISNTPILILTNLENSQVEQEARKMGIVDYLRKVEQTPTSVINLVTSFFSDQK